MFGFDYILPDINNITVLSYFPVFAMTTHFRDLAESPLTEQRSFPDVDLIKDVANELKRAGDELARSHDLTWLNRNTTALVFQSIIVQVLGSF